MSMNIVVNDMGCDYDFVSFNDFYSNSISWFPSSYIDVFVNDRLFTLRVPDIEYGELMFKIGSNAFDKQSLRELFFHE